MSDRARVLVVDNEQDPREYLRMIFQSRYDVATAESAEATLRALIAFHPALVLIGMEMPPSDSVELLRCIKRADPRIQVVMITADGSAETVKNALIHGVFEYLPKPVSRQDLEDTAQRALACRQTELGTWPRLTDIVEDGH